MCSDFSYLVKGGPAAPPPCCAGARVRPGGRSRPGARRDVQRTKPATNEAERQPDAGKLPTFAAGRSEDAAAGLTGKPQTWGRWPSRARGSPRSRRRSPCEIRPTAHPKGGGVAVGSQPSRRGRGSCRARPGQLRRCGGVRRGPGSQHESRLIAAGRVGSFTMSPAGRESRTRWCAVQVGAVVEWATRQPLPLTPTTLRQRSRDWAPPQRR